MAGTIAVNWCMIPGAGILSGLIRGQICSPPGTMIVAATGISYLSSCNSRFDRTESRQTDFAVSRPKPHPCLIGSTSVRMQTATTEILQQQRSGHNQIQYEAHRYSPASTENQTIFLRFPSIPETIHRRNPPTLQTARLTLPCDFKPGFTAASFHVCLTAETDDLQLPSEEWWSSQLTTNDGPLSAVHHPV